MSERRAIVVFTEGDFEEARTRPTLAEARAFAEGVETGAGFYGAGSCAAYVVPEDDAAMTAAANDEDSNLTNDEIEKAWCAGEVAVAAGGASPRARRSSVTSAQMT